MSQDTKYEIMYIIRPNIDEEAKTALVERFDTILKDNGAEVIESLMLLLHQQLAQSTSLIV